MTFTYQAKGNLYLNLTNKCTNNCQFCIRKKKNEVNDYDLWLEEEPTAEEVIGCLTNLDQYGEIVFCGFGEPLIKLGVVVEVCQYLKDNQPKIPVRVNTNGQANLFHGRNILVELEGLVDIISISLNASTAEKYKKICEPEEDREAFSSLIEFIKQAKKYIPQVIVSVVDYPGVDIPACRELAEKLGVEFRVRDYNH